ncbi:MAG: hypothetical protein Q9222_004047, partial [Ikaeria aurantiellina]
MDLETRNQISNGGLDITCSSCNQIGCICPEPIPHLDRFCENCRGTNNGDLRCYCTPALVANPCNRSEGGNPHCDGPDELCKDAPPIYFCDAEPWFANPDLATMTAAAVVYDFKTMAIDPGVNITSVAQRTNYPELIATATPTFPPMVAVASPQPASGKASKKIVGAGAAAAAA